MSGPDRELRQIQAWMQAVIMHPGGVEYGVNSAEALRHIEIKPGELESVIARSQALSAEQRLAIYNRAYFARLLECLRAEFPVLVHALGEETFDSFALAYLGRYPSRSYTLGRLAANFANYLAQTRPKQDVATAAGPSWPDFIIDLATFEWTFSEVFDGPGVEDEPALNLESLQAIPAERWHEARLVPVRCLRLHEFRFPVNAYFTAVRRNGQPPLPAPEATYVAVTRRGYVVRHFRLSRSQYVLLDALVAGQTVGEAITASARAAGGDVDFLTQSIRDWFHDWAREGFFSTVELPDATAD